jgi:hypothetical protein
MQIETPLSNTNCVLVDNADSVATCTAERESARTLSPLLKCVSHIVVFTYSLNDTLTKLAYLRVYKPPFFDKNLPSKIVLRLVHGILCPFDDWARGTAIVWYETPSGER